MKTKLFSFLLVNALFLSVNLLQNKIKADDNCNITTYSAEAISLAQAECDVIHIDGIEVTAGETLSLTELRDNTRVIFSGNITFGYTEWKGPLIRVIGSNVEIIGAPDHVFDGRGALWWDGEGGNGGKDKPKFFTATLNNSVVRGINIKNGPVHVFTITNCDGVILEDITVDSRDGDVPGGGHNTDAFDVGNSNNITIRYSTVHNQDDCLAVNSGSNVYFHDNYCSGGHGISIGSVGGRSNNDVRGVTVSGCEILNSENGIRIKTVFNATGSVSDILYELIVLRDITRYGMVFESDYLNGGPTGTPTGGVPITNLTVRNIRGTVLPTGSNVYVLVENASDWNFSNIAITGGTIPVECEGIPEDADLTCEF